jgi:FkbM family methyltransferase
VTAASPAAWGGAAARAVLRLLPRGLVVRVPIGPMRGMRWMPESAPNGAWLGQLERGQIDAFVSRIQPGATVWDVGANVGLYAIPSARAAGSSGAVFAFEPVPANLAYLRRHVQLNRLDNVHIVEAAVAATSGGVRMGPGDSGSEAAVRDDGPWIVPAVSLDEWRAATRTPAPILIKIDVEGAEADVLAGATETLRTARPTIFLSLHGPRQQSACRAALESFGYGIASMQPGLDVSQASEWLAEPR